MNRPPASPRPPARSQRWSFPDVATAVIVCLTVAIFVAFAISEDGSALDAVGAAAAAIALLAGGLGLVVLLERQLRRRSLGAVLPPLLEEASLWLSIVDRDPPRGWTDEVRSDQRKSLEEIRTRLAPGLRNPATLQAVRDDLIGYLGRLRALYGGRSAFEVEHHG